MMARLLTIIVVGLVLLLTTGTFSVEGRLQGPALGGRLAVRTPGRSVTFAAVCYRPNKTYYKLIAR